MSNENEIRELAYYLWITEGKPNGQSDKHWQIATKMAAEQKNGRAASKTSTDPSEAKGTTEPAQPDQT
jgi:hypothetical protein